ncbi:hypothetical protein O4214_30555 [Rhodococcus erythropolis]|uniref:hypothetical protein n=1 Tax=Rhodococcus erythropolis TaxID=1833 RepID=UPI001E35740F|nr:MULTISPECIES: hypothetical protein [Rhodococcus erythropolis group]MCD2104897.1 hypothetical protein [Rhodococcus qingshengii]MCZ4528331.1 hypothetical protein [Rhodococcus erythropolis]
MSTKTGVKAKPRKSRRTVAQMKSGVISVVQSVRDNIDRRNEVSRTRVVMISSDIRGVDAELASLGANYEHMRLPLAIYRDVLSVLQACELRRLDIADDSAAAVDPYLSAIKSARSMAECRSLGEEFCGVLDRFEEDALRTGLDQLFEAVACVGGSVIDIMQPYSSGDAFSECDERKLRQLSATMSLLNRDVIAE